ncbi:hypothetical protein [Bosea sp. RAC05]|uniref:hypothetical protein n=1 Tax=Bosea sp. RAC05 TaxID=1842539 RepID=UPI00083D29C0|nr:hypothetical protein [Bosea sp. RAC05]AOG03404.1 hypothetical protein BSY19_4865 [Bosea sp. RAC05]
MTSWVNSLDNVDPAVVARATALEAEKQQIIGMLDSCLNEEAALFMELYHSGQWTRRQMMIAAGSTMSHEVVNRLPPVLPRQRRRPQIAA